MKLGKAQLSNIIQSGVFLGNMMSNLGNESAKKNLAVSLAKDVLPKLETIAVLAVTDKFER